MAGRKSKAAGRKIQALQQKLRAVKRRPARAPARKKRPKRRSNLKNMHLCMSAFHCHEPVPKSMCVGPATFIDGIQRIDLTMSQTDDTIVILNPGLSQMVGVYGPTNLSKWDANQIFIPQFANDTAESIMWNRMSFSLRCTSSVNEADGWVVALRPRAHLKYPAASEAALKAFAKYILGAPDGRTYSATDLLHLKTLDANVLAQADYENFHDFGLVKDPSTDPVDPPNLGLSPLLIYFSKSAKATKYQLVVKTQAHFRFQPNTVLYSTMREVKTAPSGLLSTMRAAVANTGSMLHDFGDTVRHIGGTVAEGVSAVRNVRALTGMVRALPALM